MFRVKLQTTTACHSHGCCQAKCSCCAVMKTLWHCHLPPSPRTSGSCQQVCSQSLPIVYHGLDVEAEGWADLRNVLPIDALHNSGLPRVVEAPAWRVSQITSRINCDISPCTLKPQGGSGATHTIKMRISLSLRLALRMIVSKPMTPRTPTTAYFAVKNPQRT